MDNKEFAQILLNEASELLIEGARYRKEIKDKDGNSSYSYGKKASKAIAEYKDDKEELRKGAARMKYYTTSSRPHRGRKTYTNMSKKEREQMYNDIVAKTAIDYTNYNENKNLGKSLSDYNNDKLNRKMALIEKRKNRKSQNESIAILLTEAAELLNEEVKILNGPLMDNHELNSRLSNGLTPEQAMSDIANIQNQINILEQKRHLTKQDKKRLVEMRNNIAILKEHIKR